MQSALIRYLCLGWPLLYVSCQMIAPSPESPLMLCVTQRLEKMLLNGGGGGGGGGGLTLC